MFRVYKSFGGIRSRVRELSKTIAIRVQKFYCFESFFVPEASGHFCWFSGSSCLDDAVCIFIRFQCFDEACCLDGFMSGGVFGYKQEEKRIDEKGREETRREQKRRADK